jgi:hypothetical protein
LLGTQKADVGHILENVIFLELYRRGYEVYIGKVGNTEVDFRRRWRRYVRPDKPPRDRTAFPSVRFGLRVNRPACRSVVSPLPDGEHAGTKRKEVN